MNSNQSEPITNTEFTGTLPVSDLSTRLASNRYSLFAGGSRWTNPNRSRARHIMFDNECLCKRQYRNTLLKEPLNMNNLDEVSCKTCIRKMNVAG